ncbi:MAG: 50S ribosomal protein L4, partial [Raoultibacter sp.]
QWAGGGTVFGPHPRSYAIKVPNKVVKLAMRSALSAKLADGELIVIEDFGFEKPSTKQAAAAIKALGCEGRTTVVVADDDVNAYLSLRNLEKVNVIPVAEANTYELIDNKKLIFTAAALSRIEEVLA